VALGSAWERVLSVVFWMKARSEGCTGLLEEALGWLLARWDLKFAWRVDAFVDGFCWENFSRSA